MLAPSCGSSLHADSPSNLSKVTPTILPASILLGCTSHYLMSHHLCLFASLLPISSGKYSKTLSHLIPSFSLSRGLGKAPCPALVGGPRHVRCLSRLVFTPPGRPGVFHPWGSWGPRLSAHSACQNQCICSACAQSTSQGFVLSLSLVGCPVPPYVACGGCCWFPGGPAQPQTLSGVPGSGRPRGRSPGFLHPGSCYKVVLLGKLQNREEHKKNGP